MQTFHITCENSRWTLREEGDERVLIEATSEDEIRREARDYMKLRVGEVQLHGADGAVIETQHYPEDQDPRATGG